MSNGSDVELQVNDQTFRFEIESSQVQMGTVAVKQLWMDTRTLHNPRPEKGGNSIAIVQSYWALCCQHDTIGDQDVRESYLLARLLPFSRVKGARRIVRDAHFGPRSVNAYRTARKDAAEELQPMLAASGMDACDPDAFREESAKALAVPEWNPSTTARYEAFCDNLLDVGRLILAGRDTERAVADVMTRWEDAMRHWGRRGGNAEEKFLLDVISYECRAAFHRCYSAIWMEMLRPGGLLQTRYNLSLVDLCFLHLWHLDHFWFSGMPDAWSHLFHGHVFGLHPACAMLAQTTTGRELIGRYISTESEDQRRLEFCRLLNGMLLALHVYMGKLGSIASDRRSLRTVDPERMQERQVEQHRGKRRP